MRKLQLFILMLVLAGLGACSKKIDINQLLGTWTAVNNNSDDPVILTSTFYSSDTLCVRSITAGKVTDSLFVRYQISDDHKFLTTQMDSVQSFKFEILQLTAEKLELKSTTSEKFYRYKR